MACSVSFYPSSSSSLRSYRRYESSLILSRVKETRELEKNETDEQTETNRPQGLTALDFRLRRDERKRRLQRNQSYRSSTVQDTQEETPPTPVEKKDVVVTDRLGNDIYVLGETNEDRIARELDQWLKKMKTVGTINTGLQAFKDIKVGVYQSDVLHGSPSYEPYPSLKDKSFTYSGGKDSKKCLHGKGSLEFDDGSCMMGYWVHGIREGDFKVESRTGPVCFLSGEYKNDKLNGRARVYFTDENWLDGYFKDGVLHGFCRYFDVKNRLTFIGMHRNGKPFGTCWKIIRGGGCVVGVVDEEGQLSGMNIAYIYPDFKTALVGNFRDGVLECGQVSSVKKVTTDNIGIKIPQFIEPDGRLYRREISTYDFVTSTPSLPDPYESKMVEVRKSRVPGANEGLFAKKAIPPSVVLAFYHGQKVKPKTADAETWEENAYKIFDPAVKDGTVDIPEEYRLLSNYTASLAHKTNHSFLPNSEFMVFNHPRFGTIPCIASKHSIAKGEEIFVRYGYELNYCPDWYLDAWEKGNFPVPDSMKNEYSCIPAWAESTVEDKE